MIYVTIICIILTRVPTLALIIGLAFSLLVKHEQKCGLDLSDVSRRHLDLLLLFLLLLFLRATLYLNNYCVLRTACS